MFKISGNNFNEWFRQLKMVLRVERKLFVIEQPISPAPPTDSEYLRSGMRYMIHNEVELKSMFEKQVGVEWFDLCWFNLEWPHYKKHNMGKTVGGLHVMLIEYEKGLPKKAETPQGKDKQVYIPKPKNPKSYAKEHLAKDNTCHNCKEVGNYKRNCSAYLVELIKKKKKVSTASSSDVFIIELFSFPTKSWVYDTSCGTIICNTKQGFRIEKKLKRGSLYLYVGNGVRAQVEAIRSFDLVLPNGLVICLDNCHYAPTITRGVVSVSRLVDNGFVQCFTDCGISVSKNGVLYFNAVPRNGIYEIDMHDLVPNVNSIYNVSNKRVKHNLDSTYLWHCRLAHINKKRIKQLQQDGLLKSTDDESFDKCESCLSGKMTKKPFPHSNERAKDLLGIIHTDVVRKLKQVESIGSFDLVLPNGLVICLDNCHYGPSIIRGVVSVYRLVENGFVQYSTYLWHCHLAHLNKKRIEKQQQEGLLKSTVDESFDQCVSCLSGKMTRKSFPHRPERVTDLLGIIHTDVCGPLRHVSRQGASYFITFTDDYSRYGYVYLLKHKHEVFETFKVFKNEVENQLGKTIKAIRSDRGGEYISQEFKDYLKANGIVQQLTPPYTPQHNGVSERRNRTLLDMVRSMMNLTTLPLSFWDYALESATRILNMVPTKKVDKTPYEMWYGKVPNLSYLKVWGCEALVKRDTPDKLEQRSVKCIFIGYPKETMGYYFYFPPENKIVVARYAEFFEKRLISQEISGRAVDLEEIQEEEDTTPSEITSNIPQEVEGFEPPQPPQEEVIPIRRSERTHRAPNRLCLNVEVEEHSLGDLNEPTSYKAAMLDSESNKWIDAMNAEIQSMMDNMVWVLVDLPPGCKTVGSKWLFKKKTDMDGIVHVYKARLVAKGYTQLYGVDYEETFSPVADIRAIRILISIAAYYDYEIWQMDVKTAFLNGYLDEDIYMVQPEGFVDPNHPRKVCKLWKIWSKISKDEDLEDLLKKIKITKDIS
ncbi:retrotransposon protein, putative, ty1-copia subclass [Tanacetum coccineum]